MTQFEILTVPNRFRNARERSRIDLALCGWRRPPRYLADNWPKSLARRIQKGKNMPIPDKSPSWLTAHEVADRCRVHIETIRKLTREGRMPQPAKIGRAYRYSAKLIDEWMAAGAPDLSEEEVTDE